MNIDVVRKTAIVTGSTEGIGFAVARGLKTAGATVVINGRTRSNVDASLARTPGTARGFAVDLGSPEDGTALLAAEPVADIVVNNLGVFQPSDFFETDDATWDRHWQVKLSQRALRPDLTARA